MQTSRVRARRLVLPALLSLLLAGCVTTQTGPAPAKTAAPAATLVARTETTAGGKEIACRIQFIDGVLAGQGDQLRPGHHRLVVALGATEGEHTGDVDLIIPAAKAYRLQAEREEEHFTLTLVEADTGKAVATSSAPAGQLMTFRVFVIQK